jgi:tetratricopeptide (TPR) repeat protein
MMKPYQRLTTALLLLVPAIAPGCTRVRANVAFKDGNKLYKEENYKRAIPEYERAVALDPNMAEAHFYLGSSHQALYRPGKEGEDNRAHLDTAVLEFQKSLEVNTGTTDRMKLLRRNTLGALIGIFSDDPMKNYDQALSYAKQLVDENPTDPKNLFAMANLFEKFGKVDDAEKMYRQAAEANPSDAKACQALAGFYNKPLWETRSKFDQAIQVLDHCATLAPTDPSGYYKVSSFYWDKAYRDPLINDKQKDEYADKGLEAVDKALQIKPDYIDAIVYKGLLYRVKAQVSSNPRLRMQYLDQAQTLQKQALELKKEQAAEGANAAANPSASPAGQ